MKKQIPVKIDADIVRWFDAEANHDINTILKGHIKIVEAQRKAASIPKTYTQLHHNIDTNQNQTRLHKLCSDQYFIPMPKPDKKKGKGKIKK